MINGYSYLLSLLFILLITYTIDAASLRSFSRSSSKWSLNHQNPLSIVNNEVITPEPILSRRRPQLISTDRRRRWSIDGDNDEIEIPIDENNIEQLLTNTSIINNQSIITEIIHPLLKQDVIEINQSNELTTISDNNNNNLTSIEDISLSTTFIDINSTELEILPTNITEIHQEISNEKNESIYDNLTTIEIISNETETATNPISVNQTIEEISTIAQTDSSTTNKFEQDTAIILLDYATIPPVTTDDNQTSIVLETQTISEYNTTLINEVTIMTTILDTISIQEGIDNITIISNTTMNNVEGIDQEIDNITTISDISLNETSTMFNDEEEYSNETISFLPKVTTKPICDRSCQCSKECPYGFEIINNKCQCDPPCKNYQCFGNDTCTVTKKGIPLCQPSKGNEYDRPIECYQPRDAGYHDTIDIRYHNRWYYNPDQDTCHLFVYRGLGGNENNFQTLHECHLQCITCAPSPDPGTCLGYIPMWYYDYKKKQCLQFKYSGCKGNENKFLRKQECIDTCITRILNL